MSYDCEVIDTSEWDKSQVDLFGHPKGKIKLGQTSEYEFVCEDNRSCTCKRKSHKMIILDWEVNELYRNLIRGITNPNLIRIKMKEKFFGFMSKRDVYLLLGTHFRFKTWMIVSILYPKKTH